MFTYIAAFVVSFIISFLTIPLIGKYALKIGFVDRPTKRKSHEKPIPMLVSIGIFSAFFITYFIFKKDINQKDIIILVCSLIILSIGIIDDWFKTKSIEFSAFPRLSAYLLCSIMIYFCGIKFVGMNVFWSDHFLVFPAFLQFFLTIMWIVGVTIVINWIDGLDGLAGGISAIATNTFFIVSLVKHQYNSALMSVILVGAVIGYLKYNLPPAKVYMADSGATFIGFVIAIISLDSAFKQVTAFSIFIPLLALGVPIFDNLRVVFKRLMSGKKIYEADKLQMHHQLINTGLNAKQATTFIFLFSICLNLLSIIILMLKV